MTSEEYSELKEKAKHYSLVYDLMKELEMVRGGRDYLASFLADICNKVDKGEFPHCPFGKCIFGVPCSNVDENNWIEKSDIGKF